MESDSSHLFDVRPHSGWVLGFDGSEQYSHVIGKLMISTAQGTKVLNNVWVVDGLTESLASIPALAQLEMDILLNRRGGFELIATSSKDSKLGRKIMDFVDDSWIMTDDFFCRPTPLKDDTSN